MTINEFLDQYTEDLLDATRAIVTYTNRMKLLADKSNKIMTELRSEYDDFGGVTVGKIRQMLEVFQDANDVIGLYAENMVRAGELHTKIGEEAIAWLQSVQAKFGATDK